jgi:hypothetical protein
MLSKPSISTFSVVHNGPFYQSMLDFDEISESNKWFRGIPWLWFLELETGRRIPFPFALQKFTTYFTSLMETTFSYMENRGILHPYFLIFTSFPISLTASFWIVPELNLKRYFAS